MPPARGFRNYQLVLLILAVGLVLRGPVNVLGPLAGPLSESLGISMQQFGILAGSPIFAFGLFAVAAPALSERFGIRGLLIGSLLCIVLGSLIRTIPLFPAVALGTFMVSAAISQLNVIMPPLIRTTEPNNWEPLVGLHSSLVALSATLGAMSAAFLQNIFGFWQSGFLFWGSAVLPALCCIFCFRSIGRTTPAAQSQLRKKHASNSASIREVISCPGALPLMGSLIGLFWLQAVLTTMMGMWLPTLFTYKGFSFNEASAATSVFLAAMVPGSLLLGFMMKIPGPFRWALTVGCQYLGTLAWVTASGAGSGLFFWAATALAGCSQGVVIAMSYAMVTRQCATQRFLVTVSSTVQCAGYTTAGLSLFLLGPLAQTFSPGVIPVVQACAVALWVFFMFAAGSMKPVEEGQGSIRHGMIQSLRLGLFVIRHSRLSSTRVRSPFRRRA